MTVREIRGPGVNAAAALLQEVEKQTRLVEAMMVRVQLLERALMQAAPTEFASVLLNTAPPLAAFEPEPLVRRLAAEAVLRGVDQARHAEVLRSTIAEAPAPERDFGTSFTPQGAARRP